jgi:hypothetical protein
VAVDQLVDVLPSASRHIPAGGRIPGPELVSGLPTVQIG